MILLQIAALLSAGRLVRSDGAGRGSFAGPPSYRRTPTLIECRDGTSRPLKNASIGDVSALRSIHPHCPSSVVEGGATLPHCTDLSFCPREFRAISPCGDCCFVCREPNEDFMAENAAAAGGGGGGSGAGASGNSFRADKSETSDPCLNIKCKRYEKCVRNIQGLPVCRCIPKAMCSSQDTPGLPVAIGGKKKKEKRSEKEICGDDGISYETKCHMHVAACHANTHIRIAHRGACMKPAESSRESEPAINVKPPRGSRKQNRQNYSNNNNNNNNNQRGYVSTAIPPAKTAGIHHQQPAIIVPIISVPDAAVGHRGGRKQGVVSWSRTSSSSGSGSGPASASSFSSSGKDRVAGKGPSIGRKSGRREKAGTRPDRPRSERPRSERPGRPTRIDRPGRVKTRFERPERTKLDKSIRIDRPRVGRPERPRTGRPEKPKATRKIQRLERKKQKLEKRLMKEKEKFRRKQS